MIRVSSTKKRVFQLAFGVRAGKATARTRAKRQARDIFWLNRHRLPEGSEVVVSVKRPIEGLTRREVRAQLSELCERACASSSLLDTGST